MQGYTGVYIGIQGYTSVYMGILGFIIHQIFSLAHDWSKRVTWANIPQLTLGNIRGYNPSINFHVILLATLRHVV